MTSCGREIVLSLLSYPKGKLAPMMKDSLTHVTFIILLSKTRPETQTTHSNTRLSLLIPLLRTMRITKVDPIKN